MSVLIAVLAALALLAALAMLLHDEFAHPDTEARS